MFATKIAHFCGGPETSHHCICTKYQLQAAWPANNRVFLQNFTYMDHTHGRFWPHHAAQSLHFCGPNLSNYFELEGSTLRHTVLTVIGKFSGAVHENFLVICISDKKDNQLIFLSL